MQHPTSYKPLLGGHLDTFITGHDVGKLWNHRTFAFSTWIGLKSQNRKWYVIYVCVTLTYTLTLLYRLAHTVTPTLAGRRVMYNYIWSFHSKFIFQGCWVALYLLCDCLNCNSHHNRIDYNLQRFNKEVPFPLLKTEEQYTHQLCLK